MTTETTEQGFPFVLTRFRKDYGLTQQKMANRLEISRSTLKSWEKGDPKRQPHVLTREGVLARLTVYEQELLCGPVANSPTPQ